MNTEKRDEMRFLKTERSMRFTLIELLVVVAIISILFSLLLPALNGAKSSAGKVACSGNLKGAGVALASYVSDSSDYLPVVNAPASGTNVPPYYWYRILAPYFKPGMAQDSSSDAATAKYVQCRSQTEKYATLYGNPETIARVFSLGMNAYLGPNAAYPYWRKLTRFAKPSGTLAVTEAGYINVPAYYPAPQTDSTYLLRSALVWDGLGVHRGANNILWLDAHASSWSDVRKLCAEPYSKGYAEDVWGYGVDSLSSQ